ncbi:MAG: TolC family protein [Oligoflexia bacterium]|nr:TolC family protein [Oligoflexia bacterium]
MIIVRPVHAEEFAISLPVAERTALKASNLLKSYASNEEAARFQADAQFQGLLPRLSLSGGYQYYAEIPQISVFGGAPIPFGTNSTYFVGPQVNYTLWDGSSTLNSYRALSLLSLARQADRDNAALQVLLSLRSAYVQVQLGIQELRLIYDSLELARAQNHDVAVRFRAGAAARLDVVTAERSVLSYEIQFKQKQADLSAYLKDLLTLLGDHEPRELSQPGPPGIPGVSLVLRLEPLRQLLLEIAQALPSPPTDAQPQIRSQELQSRSFDLSADSQSSKKLPAVQVSAGVSLNHPDIPAPPTYWQETVGVSVSMPLYLGDPSRYVEAQQRSQADAARYRAGQLRDDIHRDFQKASEMFESLREQQKLAYQDVIQSQEEAKLYYTSYKAGKINFIDVQNANNQALLAKVSAARIDAQILNQSIILKSLAGEEFLHDRN